MPGILEVKDVSTTLETRVPEGILFKFNLLLLFSQNRFNCNDDHSGLISGITTTAGCPIWVGRTT